MADPPARRIFPSFEQLVDEDRAQRGISPPDVAFLSLVKKDLEKRAAAQPPKPPHLGSPPADPHIFEVAFGGDPHALLAAVLEDPYRYPSGTLQLLERLTTTRLQRVSELSEEDQRLLSAVALEALRAEEDLKRVRRLKTAQAVPKPTAPTPPGLSPAATRAFGELGAPAPLDDTGARAFWWLTTASGGGEDEEAEGEPRRARGKSPIRRPGRARRRR